ncbi:hypothetical protein GF336_03310 [Candidatus Woesearchaeota archaeon]|nr:hypothetical protein [Candidatus Woesearchaeota archaeon]
MQKKYKGDILEIQTSCLDEGNKNHIITAYMKVKINDDKLWCFVPDWRNTFPYSPPSGYSKKYGLGDELIENLEGKKIKAKFGFVEIFGISKINEKIPSELLEELKPYTDEIWEGGVKIWG